MKVLGKNGKMKYKLWLIVFLLVVGLVYADCQSEYECAKQFELKPTSNNFNFLTNPTATDLARVSKPTPINFLRLDQHNRRTYLLKKPNDELATIYFSYYQGTFKNTADQKIAKEFFEGKKNNINDNKGVFVKYLAAQGVTLKLKGDIGNYKQGDLSTLKQKINLLDWKDKFNFQVDAKGKIILQPKGQTRYYSFEGKVEKKNRKFYLSSGTITSEFGAEATKGMGKSFLVDEGFFTFSNGKIKGEAKCIGGVCFEKPVFNSLSFDFDKLTLTKQLVIESVASDTTLKIDSGKYTVQVKKGELDQINKAIVTLKKGKVTHIKTQKKGMVYLRGIGVKGDLKVNYDKVGKEKNQLVLKKEGLELKGKGKVLFDKYELRYLYKKIGKDYKKSYANKFFVGTRIPAQPYLLNTDQYDRFEVMVKPSKSSDSRAKIDIKKDKLTVDLKGRARIHNGYWAVELKNDKLFQGIDGSLVTGSTKDKRAWNYRGYDTIQMEVTGDWKNKEKGPITILDRKARADLIKVPFGYTGISNGDRPQNQEEFREYIVWYAKLLEGYPYDSGEHRSKLSRPNHPKEGWLTGINFVCTDISEAIGLAMGDVDLGPKVVLVKGTSRSFGKWEDNLLRNTKDLGKHYVPGSYTYTRIGRIPEMKESGTNVGKFNKKQLDKFFSDHKFKKGDMITKLGAPYRDENRRRLGHTMIYGGKNEKGEHIAYQTSDSCKKHAEGVFSACETNLNKIISRKKDYVITGKLTPNLYNLEASRNLLAKIRKDEARIRLAMK